MDQILLALAAQFPLVAAFFTAIQQGWIYAGTTVTQLQKNWDDQKAEWKSDKEFLVGLLRSAIEERKASEERVANLTTVLNDAVNTLNQQQEFNDKVLDELKRALDELRRRPSG